MGFFGAAHRWEEGGKKDSLPKICHTSYNDETWQLQLTQERYKKYIKYETHPLLTSEPFHQKPVVTFVISRNTNIDCILIHIFNFQSFNLFLVFKVSFNNQGCNLMMSAKLATLGLLRIKVLQDKGYDVIISVQDVTNTMNQIFSRESNYIVHVVITSIL